MDMFIQVTKENPMSNRRSFLVRAAGLLGVTIIPTQALALSTLQDTKAHSPEFMDYKLLQSNLLESKTAFNRFLITIANSEHSNKKFCRFGPSNTDEWPDFIHDVAFPLNKKTRDIILHIQKNYDPISREMERFLVYDDKFHNNYEEWVKNGSTDILYPPYPCFPGRLDMEVDLHLARLSMDPPMPYTKASLVMTEFGYYVL
jgi:hypothetical protein